MVSERKRKVRELDSPYIRKQERIAEDNFRKKKGLFRRLTALAIVAGTLGAVAFMTIHTQAKVLEEKEIEKAALEAQLLELQSEEDFLVQEIENYNDLDYIAEIARRDFLLSKEREILFKMPVHATD